MTEAKSRTGKGKPVCVLLHTERNGVDFMMNTMPGMEKHLMMLNHALAQNNNVRRRIRLLRIKIVDY
jgi:transketolase